MEQTRQERTRQWVRQWSDEGRRCQMVERCEPDDPEFDSLILTALQDYDEKVVDVAIGKYLGCDIDRKKTIIPTTLLNSWLRSANISQRQLAARLLPGRNDIAMDDVLPFFQDDDDDTRKAIIAYYQSLDAEEKKKRFSLDDLERSLNRRRASSGEKKIWAGIIAVYPAGTNQEKERVASAIKEYFDGLRGLNDMLAIVGYLGTVISCETAERLARACSGEEKRSREDTVDTILKYLDRSSITPSTMNLWLRDFRGEGARDILTEVMIRMLIQNDICLYDGFSYEEWFWDHLCNAAWDYCNDMNDKAAKMRFNAAIDLYRQLPIEKKQEAAPEELLEFRIDDGEKYEYVIASLCVGRYDLSDSTIYRIARYVKRWRRPIFYESLRSIYIGRLSHAYDKQLAMSTNESIRDTAINNFANEITQCIDLELEVLNFRWEGGHSNATQYIFDLIGEILGDSISTDVVEGILSRVERVNVDAVLNWPQIDMAWKIDQAITLATNSHLSGRVAEFLASNEESWHRLSDDAIASMSKSADDAVIKLAIRASADPNRRNTLHEDVLASAIANSHDADIITDAVRCYLEDDRLATSKKITVALLVALTETDDDVAESVRSDIADEIL